MVSFIALPVQINYNKVEQPKDIIVPSKRWQTVSELVQVSPLNGGQKLLTLRITLITGYSVLYNPKRPLKCYLDPHQTCPIFEVLVVSHTIKITEILNQDQTAYLQCFRLRWQRSVPHYQGISIIWLQETALSLHSRCDFCRISTLCS